MWFKRIAAIVLVIALAAAGVALYVMRDRYEERIAEYEAAIAALEREVEIADYVATFDGGHVTAAEAKDMYDNVKKMYEQYGYSFDGFEDQVKQDIVETLAKEAVVDLMAAELGLDQPDEEKAAELQEAANANFDEYVQYYRPNFEAEGKSEEDVVAETTAFLAENGLTAEILYQNQLDTFASNQLFAHIAETVEVTEEDVRAKYDALVEADQTNYANGGYNYESAMSNGTAVYWNPEGYRTVKHVLIQFNDEQKARYTEITNRMTALEGELAALENPAEAETAATEAPETTAAPDATETTVAPEATETAEAPRTAEEINKELDAAKAELDALYEELAPTANEVVEKFNAGESIESLIEAYGSDPGMTAEPGLTNGYVVAANSVLWDPAFTEAAMSIDAVGEISEPARGSYGIHVIYYLADIVPGAVDFELARETLSGSLLDEKQAAAYDEQIDAWMTERNITYYLENFR